MTLFINYYTVYFYWKQGWKQKKRSTKIRWNVLAKNSLPCTVRTARQRSYNQRVGCLMGVTLLNTQGDWTSYTAIQNENYVQGGVERTCTRSVTEPTKGHHTHKHTHRLTLLGSPMNHLAFFSALSRLSHTHTLTQAHTHTQTNLTR